jgi:preprotein translocase subunit SecY
MTGANQSLRIRRTSILIIVGVALDTVNPIEGQRQQRNYERSPR